MAVQGAIQKAAENKAAVTANGVAKKSLTFLMNDMLDSEGYRKRFNELLGARSPQFVSSIISLVTASKELQQAFNEAPVTIIQAALKAATYDLPIDPGLGFAYIVPFKNKKADPPRMEAVFVPGYKGLNQLALRTGMYARLNVTDVREGELKSYNRLTEDIEIEFIEDEEERAEKPVVGWVGYFRLTNGAEKTIYMSRKEVEKHEIKNRKGQYMTKTWRDDFESMAAKTVFRRLVGKYGIMSIDYRHADTSAIKALTDISSEKMAILPDGEGAGGWIDGEYEDQEEAGDDAGSSAAN